MKKDNFIYDPYISPIPINWNPINKISFEDAPTDYMLLVKLSNKVNEIIEQLNSYEPESTEYIDQQISAVYQAMADMRVSLEQLITQTKTACKVYTDKNIVEVLQALEELANIINDRMIKLKVSLENELKLSIAMLQQEMETLKSYVDTALEKYSITCHNPITGTQTSVCQAISDIYEQLRYNAITAGEFDESGISAGEFDALGISAIEFDTNSKSYIYTNMCKCLMIDPYTGLLANVSDVIAKIVTMSNAGLTADGFDDLELTASTFDGKQVTAFEFDFNGSVALT